MVYLDMTGRLYDTARWKRRRAAFLAANPLCRFCEAVSRITLATVVDHVRPHKEDETLFFDGVVTTANRKQFFQFSYP